MTASIDVRELSYEQARDELVEVVNKLEGGAASLEESLDLWERGEALADRCQSWLDAARERIEAARSEGASTDGDENDDAESASEPATVSAPDEEN